MSERLFVIVGGGLAGAKAARTLRDEGFDGRVVLVSRETELPYERPPLSKGYLLGKEPFEKAVVNDREWYDTHGVELRSGVSATSLDPAAHTVGLDDGATLTYDRLLLATGALPRLLDVPGADEAPVRYLRTRADSDELRADLAGGTRRVVVIGGGWIGLEAAAAARELGHDVTVLFPAELPLLAPLGREMAAVFAALHTDHGVVLVPGSKAAAIEPDGSGWLVRDEAGTTYAADVLVAGIGAVPDSGLAEAAGLDMERGGVLADPGLRTSDPDVLVAGDIAAIWYDRYQTHIRLEHWATALNSGPAAARSMLGQEVVYERVPYFYTDQFDLGMEYSGRSADATQVVTRGAVAAREFVAFWIGADGRVLAGMNVNIWDVVEDIQALLRSEAPVDLARLTDPTVALSELLA